MRPHLNPEPEESDDSFESLDDIIDQHVPEDDKANTFIGDGKLEELDEEGEQDEEEGSVEDSAKDSEEDGSADGSAEHDDSHDEDDCDDDDGS